MSDVNPIWDEEQRKRWLRPDWQRWVRHDSHRFLPPGQFEAKSRTAQIEADEVDLSADWEANRADHASPQAYGTAVHSRVERLVNGAGSLPEDPNFRAEVSASKSGEARRGALGSKRIDVFETPGTGTVCVYDIKTGEKTDLSFARMSELARSANRLYPGTNRIIVTEVRPNK